MPPLTSLILGLHGIIGILNGVPGLIFPSIAVRNAQIMEISSAPAVDAIALGSVSLGVFYLNAAYRRDIPIMWMSVVGRMAAVIVFWPRGGVWRNVALFEGICGLSLVLARGWDVWGRGRYVEGKDQ
ncbi:hypothetical protein LSUE1_G002437 [Lachnellula suecica]|uniref:Uncharacterized protein n=1 Tax=Lachnellula suecica TaxID=602035 RepID=A0A8T9CIK9_9HELO|nr:hypothetical protein LSUE1_G002437 [Lachnellula suecica]